MEEKTLSIPENAAIAKLFTHQLRKRGWLEKLIGPEWYRLVYGVFTNPLSIVGLVITSLFILTAAFAPSIAPPVGPTYNPYLIPRDGYAPEPKAPGTIWNREPPPVPGWYKFLTGKDYWVHLFGTTSGQFDIFYGVVWGTRIALFVGVFITFVETTIGLIVGAISAYYVGWLDDILAAHRDFYGISLPSCSPDSFSNSGASFWEGDLAGYDYALITFGWMTYARLIRGEMLSAKERDFVMAARVVGSRDSRIILKHIVPNAIYPILILASMSVGDYVLAFATLSFLGVGTEIGYADWGQIVSFSRDWIMSLDVYWYIIVYPGVALLLFGLGWNLIGDALRDILDPRLRGRD